MDTLGTAATKSRVLAAWSASPARFREDANAEEELVLGAYRDRLIVELAQNAADAAARAGISGRLLLRLRGSTLVAANTGAPLDRAGVEGLSTLRASTKPTAGGQPEDHHTGRPAPLGLVDVTQVGRFGVGFAAVLTVTDEPAIHSRTGAVRWSRTQTRRLAEDIPALAPELEHRDGAVPVLRLPFPVGPDADVPEHPVIPAGYDTCVVLPLRDDAAEAATHSLLEAVDDALPLSLPALGEITIETAGQHRTITASAPIAVGDGLWQRSVGGRTWRLATSSGQANPELMSDRPVEERRRPGWFVTVTVPLDASGAEPAPLPSSVPAVLHAPTPTDDRTDLPALVIASLPLDSTRRRVAPGPLTDYLADHIGGAYARLVASFDTPAVLALVPSPIGAGELDAVVHRRVMDALSRTELVPGAGPDTRIRPVDVTIVDGLDGAADPAELAPYVAGLPAASWWRADVLQRLGARVTPLSDLVDELAALTITPQQWGRIYAALEGADPEALGALPVPLMDGRVVRGPRTVLLPGAVDVALLAPFPLRIVDPQAVHPLLSRLGAAEASPASVLREPQVRAMVDAADDQAAELGAAVLRLVAAAGTTHAEHPWLDQLPLPDATGTLVPAGDLLLPGSWPLDVLDVDPDEYTVAGDIVDRHGEQTLRAVGVREGFATVREADVALDHGTWHDLDGEDAWITATVQSVPASSVPPLLAELVAVRDLDLVRAESWAEVLSQVAADPVLRAAVIEPAHVLLPDGTRHAVEPYTSWWLRTKARLHGHALEELCTTGATSVIRKLLPSAHGADLDEAFAAAVGIARSLLDVPADVLLRRLAEETVQLTSPELADIYMELASRSTDLVDPPARLRVPAGVGTKVVDAADVVVCDSPYWLQLAIPAAVPGPPELADALAVDLVTEVYDAEVDSAGITTDVPAVVHDILPGAPATYVEHDDLVVAGRSVDWWVDGGTVHASTFDGLARGLAWAGGAWSRRWVLSHALEDPTALPAYLDEDAFD